MNRVETAEVGIIGFGPAGTAVAARLVEHGLSPEQIGALDPGVIGAGNLANFKDLGPNSPPCEFFRGDVGPVDACTLSRAKVLDAPSTSMDRVASYLHAEAEGLLDAGVGHISEQAEKIVVHPDGTYEIRSESGFVLNSLRAVVQATGAWEEPPQAWQDRPEERTFTSAEVLSDERFADLVKQARDGHTVAIVGASHGGYSVLARLKREVPEAKIQIFGTTLPYFRSEAEAGEFGYEVVDGRDVVEPGPDRYDVNRWLGVRDQGWHNQTRSWFLAVRAGLVPGVEMRSREEFGIDTLSKDAALVWAGGYNRRRRVDIVDEDGRELDVRLVRHNGYAQFYAGNTALQIFEIGNGSGLDERTGEGRFADGVNTYYQYAADLAQAILGTKRK